MRILDLLSSTQSELLANLESRDKEERQAGIREASSLKALAPSVAQLLYLLILWKNSKTIVEFGTSHGYSTIYLAAAAEYTGGHVFTVDVLPEKTQWAQQNLEAAGLLDRVTLATAEGADFVATLPHEIDLVLVDYGIAAFASAFPLLRAKIASGGLLLIDGGGPSYWSSGAGGEFRSLLERDPTFLVSILQMHREQLVAIRITE